jgi:hypothetical protein
MASKREEYMRMVAKAGHNYGEPRAFRASFEAIKEMSKFHGRYGFRSLVTGILLLALADASGVNYMQPIHNDRGFGDVLRFKERDLRAGLARVGVRYKAKEDSLIELMRTNYNGYRFMGSTEALYNPTLCNNLLRSSPPTPRFGKRPDNGEMWSPVLSPQRLPIGTRMSALPR